METPRICGTHHYSQGTFPSTHPVTTATQSGAQDREHAPRFTGEETEAPRCESDLSHGQGKVVTRTRLFCAQLHSTSVRKVKGGLESQSSIWGEDPKGPSWELGGLPTKGIFRGAAGRPHEFGNFPETGALSPLQDLTFRFRLRSTSPVGPSRPRAPQILPRAPGPELTTREEETHRPRRAPGVLQRHTINLSRWHR